MIGHDVPVVVSIATIPSRIAHIRPTLESLLAGALPSDLILVNAPDFCTLEKAGYEVPGFLAGGAAFDPRVRLVRSAVDWGPGTKVLGPLAHLPNPCILVIADDDVLYHREFLARLVTAQRAYPRHAYSFYTYRAWGLPIGQGCDGLSFWSPHLAGIRDFAERFVGGTTLVYHDDIWIAFFLALRKVAIRKVALPPNAALIYEQRLPNTVLASQDGQLKRQRILETHMPRLLREAGVPPILGARLMGQRAYDVAVRKATHVRRRVARLGRPDHFEGKGGEA